MPRRCSGFGGDLVLGRGGWDERFWIGVVAQPPAIRYGAHADKPWACMDVQGRNWLSARIRACRAGSPLDLVRGRSACCGPRRLPRLVGTRWRKWGHAAPVHARGRPSPSHSSRLMARRPLAIRTVPEAANESWNTQRRACGCKAIFSDEPNHGCGSRRLRRGQRLFSRGQLSCAGCD
jgi:hypothetical protein